MTEVIEGRWEDLAGRQDLQGRLVRVVVLDEGEKGAEDPWLKSLRAWMDGHEAPGAQTDDSRESIYSGTMDDPR
jgi:hypothetical protein